MFLASGFIHLLFLRSGLALRLGSVLLERRHDHVVHALNTITRVLNNKELVELRTCTVDQISILVVQRHDHALLLEKAKGKVRNEIEAQVEGWKVSAEDCLTACLLLRSSPVVSVQKLSESGIDVIIGPPEEQISRTVQFICNHFGIPFIKYTSEFHSCSEKSMNQTFNLYPKEQQIRMLTEVLPYWKWSNYAIAVSKRTASCHIHRMATLMRGRTPVILEVDDASTDGFMGATNLLRDICDRKSCWNNVNRVIIDMSPEKTLGLLDMSLKLGLINSINWFLLTNLDNLFDYMEPYSHNKMRISLLAPWNSFSDDSNVLKDDHSVKILRELYSDWLEVYPNILRTPNRDFAMIFDSVLLACQVEQQKRQSVTNTTTMNSISFTGLTGPVSFNGSGERIDTSISVWELGINGRPINTGFWRSTESGASLTMRAKEIPWTHEHALKQIKSMRILRVTSIAERPYVMEKKLSNGRVIYEGFCVDLLDKLAEYLNFEYRLHIVRDGKYGEPIKNGSGWDGMVGEILRDEVDMAVAPITVTALRLEAVDFTDPFLQLGISMLMRQPDKGGGATLTSFLLPLSPRIWLFTVLATVATSLLVTCIGFISPVESTHEFTITNSIWYLACILLRAGSGYNCQSVSARLASTVWWSFTLVLIAQYTANFAAVLTVDRITMPFNSFEELGNQTEYSFGSILGGSTMQFFKYSRIETFQRIWLRMQNMTPSAFVDSNDNGVRRVLTEKYVFLMESASLEYQVAQNCNLTRVGNVVLGSNGYSIAVPKGSRWREKLTRQILDFNEKGIMMMLKNNWWKPTDGSESCTTDAVQSRQSLGMDQVAGLFVLLAVGLFVGIAISLAEKCLFAFYRMSITRTARIQ